MEEKKSLTISLSTFFLILAIIVIAIMGYFIYKISIEKSEAEQKITTLTKELNTLKNTANTLQSKINSISTTLNSSNSSNTNDSTSAVTLDTKYENFEYGITFSYPSSFSSHENSLTNDMVESFSDNNGNEIVIARFSNDTIEDMIDFEKNKVMPDGSKINLDIKKEGYVTLSSGTKGYSIETNNNNIIFITEKNNTAFRFTITYTDNNDQLSNEILNSLSIK